MAPRRLIFGNIPKITVKIAAKSCCCRIFHLDKICAGSKDFSTAWWNSPARAIGDSQTLNTT